MEQASELQMIIDAMLAMWHQCNVQWISWEDVFRNVDSLCDAMGNLARMLCIHYAIVLYTIVFLNKSRLMIISYSQCTCKTLRVRFT